jgi:hypothetical protein
VAISGSSTGAFMVVVKGSELSVVPITTLRSECVDAQDAVKLLRQGFRAVVKGSDMAQFYDLWRQSAG